MQKQWPRVLSLGLALILLACTVSFGQQPVPATQPRNVIMMIPDGMGPSAVTLTRLVSGRKTLAMDEHLIGAAMTSSENRLVTDSAAAATALATGIRTNNDYIGVSALGEPVATVLEAARQQRRMATGLVVTCRLSYATPAGFAAHAMDRDEEENIAAQMLELRVDVMMGGGRNFFTPLNAGGKRKDNRDLLAEARTAGYQVVTSREVLAAPTRMPLLAFFAMDNMQYEIDRPLAQEPSLEEMTRRAIELLASREEGFFLMVEGSRIDHTAHVHDGGALVREVLAYDAAFAAAVEFARRDGRTLVVSVADHETGGMTINGGQWDTAKPGPMLLNVNKASVEAMVDMVTGGQSLAAVVAKYAGISNLTSAETNAYAAATAGKASEAKSRRILALAKIISGRTEIAWTTTGHSAIDVDVYAFGPGQERFRGAHPSAQVATTIADLLKLDLAKSTRELRSRMGPTLAPPTTLP